jgi:hypothetical protein
METKPRISGTIASDRIGFGYMVCVTPKQIAAATKLITEQCGVTEVEIYRTKATKPVGFFSDGFTILTLFYTGVPQAW